MNKHEIFLQYSKEGVSVICSILPNGNDEQSMPEICWSVILSDFALSWHSHDSFYQVMLFKECDIQLYPIRRAHNRPDPPLLLHHRFWVGYSKWALIASYIAGVEGEINFSLKGTLFGVGASLVGAFYTIFLQRYLKDVIKNSWELTFYNNLNSCAILPLLCLAMGEVEVVWAHRAELSLSFFVWTAFAGIVGLFVGIATQMQIKYTSSLSHNISGVMKNCIQSFIGAAIYQTPLTLKGICGVLLVVGGSLPMRLRGFSSVLFQNKKSKRD